MKVIDIIWTLTSLMVSLADGAARRLVSTGGVLQVLVATTGGSEKRAVEVALAATVGDLQREAQAAWGITGEGKLSFEGHVLRDGDQELADTGIWPEAIVNIESALEPIRPPRVCAWVWVRFELGRRFRTPSDQYLYVDAVDYDTFAAKLKSEIRGAIRVQSPDDFEVDLRQPRSSNPIVHGIVAAVDVDTLQILLQN